MTSVLLSFEALHLVWIGLAFVFENPIQVEPDPRQVRDVLERTFARCFPEYIDRAASRIELSLAHSPATEQRIRTVRNQIPEIVRQAGLYVQGLQESAAYLETHSRSPDLSFISDIQTAYDQTLELLVKSLDNGLAAPELTLQEQSRRASQLDEIRRILSEAVIERCEKFPDSYAPIQRDLDLGLDKLQALADNGSWASPFVRPLAEVEMTTIRDEIRASASRMPDELIRLAGDPEVQSRGITGLLYDAEGAEESHGLMTTLWRELGKMTVSSPHSYEEILRLHRDLEAWRRKANLAREALNVSAANPLLDSGPVREPNLPGPPAGLKEAAPNSRSGRVSERTSNSPRDTRQGPQQTPATGSGRLSYIWPFFLLLLMGVAVAAYLLRNRAKTRSE